MNIHTFSDHETLLRKTQEKLEEIFLNNSNKSILFLSSGGSSLSLLDGFDFSIGPNVTVTMLDERGYTDPLINNFSQLSRTKFFRTACDKGCEFIETILNEGESPEELAARFGAGIELWMQNHPDGIIVATIGLGQDGHIAGMMPHPEAKEFFTKTFVETNRLVVSYDASDKNEFANRITVTVPVLKRISFPIVFFHGESKRKPWEMVVQEDGTLANTPARILQKMQNVEVFTDLSL